MSPSQQYRPDERLHVSTYAFKPQHVQRIAHRIAKVLDRALPSYYIHQNDYADWIVHDSGASTAVIAEAHRWVLNTYNNGSPQGIFRRGRKLGSKNKNGYRAAAPAASWEADLGLAESPATPLPAPIETPAQPQILPPAIDLANYVTKPQLGEAIDAVASTLNHNIRTHNKEVGAYVAKLESKINNIVEHRPTIITLERRNLPPVELGLQHKAFPLLLKTCNTVLRNGLRVIPWVYGPAGTGKSIGAEKVAEALSLPFYAMGTTLVKFEVLGFINTSGYQTTPFRQAYEHGGVFCADEMDSWAKEATVALNNGLANGECAFPDKTVKRHPNFIMIAAANTVGHGATLDYVGRNKQDGATLNRFVYVNWPHDDALEDSLVADKDWLVYVRHVRQRAINCGINPRPLITMRASIFGEALLASDIDRDTVIEMTLRQGLSDAQWAQIK